MPDPDAAARAVRRCDCAVGYTVDDYTVPGAPRVTYAARLKPRVHHSKAGNMNNVLYNCGASGRYVVILDNDMEPNAKFLISVLPLFFEHLKEPARSGGSVANPVASGAAGDGVEMGAYDGGGGDDDGPWKAVWDEGLGRYYFYNEDTNETAWEKPARGASTDVDSYMGGGGDGGEAGGDGTVELASGYTDDVAFNTLAFVQTPQCERDAAPRSRG